MSEQWQGNFGSVRIKCENCNHHIAKATELLESALAAEREKAVELQSQLAEVTLERDGLKLRNDNQARTIGDCHDTIKNAGLDPCVGVAKGVAAILAQRDALADRVRGLEGKLAIAVRLLHSATFHNGNDAAECKRLFPMPAFDPDTDFVKSLGVAALTPPAPQQKPTTRPEGGSR